ncbi:MAG: preprotein translocase subunit SecG [Actinobacteria bacterium]|uniref:preprotein translocase subunit SecG n=1 Tax=Propionicimonas sp. T2.31MG-18 TaxID=3157620 RepID=UPI0036703F17|nr:preprotein translocase subunit SecG [Actinomycetota bacterium]
MLRVTALPLVTTWPIVTLQIVLILTSIVLALFILLHKSRGGGMSDLFGGGMSTGMGGTSVAERNLDRLTIMVGLVWLASIIGLLVLYRYFPEVGALG